MSRSRIESFDGCVWNLNGRQDSVDPGKDSSCSFFRIAASRPFGPPAMWVGASLQAAAGQATTAVRLQTY